MSPKYFVWITGKEEEGRIIHVPNIDRGIRFKGELVKDRACSTIYFGWSDRASLRFRRYKPNGEISHARARTYVKRSLSK